MTSFVMTVMGPDRPGLVEALARVVAEHRGNWLESRMARLAGQFAGVVRVELEPAAQSAFLNAVGALEKNGLTVQARSSDLPDETAAVALTLDIVGQDRPGIVSQIARIVASHGLNIVEFTSGVVSAPMTGEPMFQAQARLHAPASADLAAVRAALEAIAADLMVDVSLGAEA